MSTELLVVLPLRLKSARIPQKMLKKIAGNELAVRTAQRALAAFKEMPGVRVAAAVDDESVAKLLRTKCKGVDVVMTDPELPSGTDRVFAALMALYEREPALKKTVKGVLNVQGDMPFVGRQGLAQIAAYYLESDKNTLRDFPVSTLSVPWPTGKGAPKLSDAGAVKVIVDRMDRAIYFSRQPLPDAALHVGVYGYTPEALTRFCTRAPVALEIGERLEQLRALWLGMPILVLRTQEGKGESFRGIDTPKDLTWAQAFARKST